MALIGPTNPAAGVTATRPTTIAVADPTAVGLPVRAMSRNVHATSVPAGASIVVVNASAAMPLAPSALPALKPNHPNHSSPAPSSVNGTLCGSSDDEGHRAAGEIERAHLRQPAAAPHPVRNGGVDDEHPARDEGHIRREAHPLDDGPGDQRGGDDAERALVAHEQQVRNRAVRVEPDAAERHPRQVTDQR